MACIYGTCNVSSISAVFIGITSSHVGNASLGTELAPVYVHMCKAS